MWAPELGLPALTSAYGGVTAAVAGFVGGFVGALVSTGNLSAAFTAGLVSGIAALAFYGAGFIGNSSGSPWEVSENRGRVIHARHPLHVPRRPKHPADQGQLIPKAPKQPAVSEHRKGKQQANCEGHKPCKPEPGRW